MNTIYWLSVFGTITGIGIFLLSILGTWLSAKNGSLLEQFSISQVGQPACWRWSYLLVGIISLIIWLTL